MSNEAMDFEKIYETFRPRIHRYLIGMVGEHEAEDLTQEVFTKVSRGLAGFKGESQLSTWIYRIATHAAVDRMRATSFRQDSQTNSLSESNGEEVEDVPAADEKDLPDQLLMQKEMYECFWDYVEELPAGYRIVFVLSDLEELSNEEIARTLGLSLEAVKTRLHRAREKLFKRLRSDCKPEEWL